MNRAREQARDLNTWKIAIAKGDNPFPFQHSASY